MKILRNFLICILIAAAIISTASAGKESIITDALKDTVIAMGSVSSNDYSYVYVSATAGENSEAIIYAQGEGDWLDITTSLYMETDDPVSAISNSYVSADEVDVGSEAMADSTSNSISLSNYVQGIGDAQGYVSVYGWE